MSKMIRLIASLCLIGAITPVYSADEKHVDATKSGSATPAPVPLNPGKKPLLEKVKENPTGFRDDVKREASDKHATKGPNDMTSAGESKTGGKIRHPHHEILHKHVPAKAARVNILEDVKNNPHKYNDRLHKPKTFGETKPSEDH